MGLPAGGFADKVGNRHEALYVVSAALEVYRSNRASLRWEGLGGLFRGIEYRLTLQGGSIECVQCKGAEKNWTIGMLDAEGVLSAIKSQLTSAHASRFVLILAGTARPFRELTERALMFQPDVPFVGLLTKAQGSAFKQMLKYWQLPDDTDGHEQARAWLSRTCVHEHRTLDLAKKEVERECEDCFKGPVSASWAAIRDILEVHLGQSISADKLLEVLRSDPYKIEPRDWSRVPDAIKSVNALRDRFLAQLKRRLIRGQLLARPESQLLLNAIGTAGGPGVL
ncbi:MAG: hypothetical protein AABZ53_09425, partial [Planctomycetota bacterium]